MKTTLNTYQKNRDSLLAEIIASLSDDERFTAAWLTGSFSRNEADALSDIDITVVVSDTESSTLCLRLSEVSNQTSPERYSLFSQFGTPALIHENNHNAPEGGTFTFILYSESAIMIDWILIPQSNAVRPHQSKLLFDKVGIPASSPPAPELIEESKKVVAERWAFFWMMIAVTIKYTIREDSVFVTQWIENLTKMIEDIERHLDGKAWNYVRGSRSKLQATPQKQVELIRQLCNKMQKLQPRVAQFTESETLIPLEEIETLLSLSKK